MRRKKDAFSENDKWRIPGFIFILTGVGSYTLLSITGKCSDKGLTIGNFDATIPAVLVAAGIFFIGYPLFRDAFDVVTTWWQNRQ